MSLISIISQLTMIGFDDSSSPSNPSITNPLFIFAGESNSGGVAPNSSAISSELQSRISVQILNNTNLLFENLDIGTNNLIGHTGLESYQNNSHGWELGLANLVENNIFPNSKVYIVKTGQGGSTISQWNEMGFYWSEFKTRVDAALQIDPTFTPILFYTHGINDAIAGTNIETWKTATIAHFTKIRTRYGNDLPIIWPKLMSTYSAYNTAIDEVVEVTNNCWTVETTDLTLLGDGNHWDYNGMKTMIERMIIKLLENYDFSINFNNSIIIADGNSYVQGNGYIPFTTTISSTSPFNSNGSTVLNFGVGAQTTVDMINDQTSQILNQYQEGVTNILLVVEGGNDIYFNGSVANALLNMEMYCLTARAVGFKIIVSTTIPRDQTTSFGDNSQQYNLKLQEFNDGLISNNTFYDAIIRPDLEPIFLTYTSGGYDGDKVHPNTIGQEKFGELFVNTILSL